MADRRVPRGAVSRGAVSRGAVSRDQWAAQIAALEGGHGGSRARKAPITVDRIVAAAFQLVEAEGFDALTMRRAAALQTGSASLYGHVRGKAELDDLLIGQLCARVTVPAPDPARWREQVMDVCRGLRDPRAVRLHARAAAARSHPGSH